MFENTCIVVVLEKLLFIFSFKIFWLCQQTFMSMIFSTNNAAQCLWKTIPKNVYEMTPVLTECLGCSARFLLGENRTSFLIIYSKNCLLLRSFPLHCLSLAIAWCGFVKYWHVSKHLHVFQIVEDVTFSEFVQALQTIFEEVAKLDLDAVDWTSLHHNLWQNISKLLKLKTQFWIT